MLRVCLLCVCALLLAGGCAVSTEGRLIGVWTAMPAESKVPTIPVPAMEDKIQDYLGTFLLKLRSDHTFLFASGVGVSGTWELTGNNLKLTPNKGSLNDMMGNSMKELKCTLNADHSRISIEQPTMFGTVVIVLRKTA